MISKHPNYLLLLTCSVFICCATTKERREITGVQYVINDIEFQGVTRFKKKEILEYLFIGETSWLPFTETYYFSEARVPLDSERIESLYRAYGYYDAKVTDFRALPKGKRPKKVNLFISVTEGNPIIVRRVNILWPDGPPRSPLANSPSPKSIESLVTLKVNDPLEVPRILDSAAAMKGVLQKHGFALANVESAAIVNQQEKNAEVTFTIREGPFARIGTLRVRGLRRVPKKLVLREVDFASGKPFSPELLGKMEKSLFGLDLFDTAEAIPDKSLAPDGRLPLTIVVSESKQQSIKVGLGLAFEPARWEQRVTTQYSHRDIFGEFTRLDLRLRAGYAELPTLFDIEEHGPVIKLEPRLVKKGLLEKKLVWTAAPSYELGVQEGYQFHGPSTRLSVSRLFAAIFEAELSHNFQFVDFFNISPILDRNRSILGLDFKDPYILSYVELNTHLYFVDQIFEPKNGIVLRASYAIAGGILGGSYDYQKISPEIRGYWQMFPRVQVAGRVETGYIVPYGDRPAAPFNMKFYLGGADSVRGWGQRRLAPKTELCPQNDVGNCKSIPIGGNTMILGGLELRIRTVGDLYAVAFGDLGDIQPGEFTYRPREWNYSAGGGLRYASPIGKFRLDVGVRLNDSPLTRGEPKWAFHLGLGEAF